MRDALVRQRKAIAAAVTTIDLETRAGWPAGGTAKSSIT